MQYKYSLDNSSKKHTCPQCGKKSFVAYLDNETKQPVDPYRFGRCDRENSCAYHLGPWEDQELAAKARETFVPKPEPQVVQIFPDDETVNRIIKRTRTAVSPFHKYCNSKLIPNDHLIRFGVYSDDDKTVFVFRNAAGKVCNLKYFKYKDDGHRDKEFNAFSLKNPPPPPDQKDSPATVQKYFLCLFGEHLLDPEKQKIVCVVESEKTAAVASFFYPQFDWVACGSNVGLTDGQNGRPDKISVLKGRKVYWLSDADEAGRMRFRKKQDGTMEIFPSSIRHLDEHKIDYEVVDLFPDRNDGYDICDAIMDGLRPEIKPTAKPSLEKPKVESDDQVEYDLPDGVEFEKVKWDIRKYMHFEHEGRIYIVRKKKGTGGELEARGFGSYYCAAITNFTIRALGLIASQTDPSRLVEIKNVHGFAKEIQVPTKAFTSQTEFRNFIESVGNFQYDGVGTDLNKIRSKLYDSMATYEEIETLGWHPSGYFIFANGAYNGKFAPIDKYGFVKLGQKNFFIPPLSIIHRENEEEDLFLDEKKFVFRERKDVGLKDWSALFCKVHKHNGMIAMAWYITSLFRDYVYQRFKFFPHAFAFGPPGTGKSQLGWSIRAMGFTGLVKPFNLNTGTAVAFHREFQGFRNFPAWCDEYDNNIAYERIQALKAAYDGVGHKKSVKDSDKRTKSTQVNRAIFISGQQLPIADNALFKRVILLQFNQTEYTDQEKKDFADLQAMEEGGLTHITAGFMHFRKLIEENYMTEFDNVLNDVMKSAEELGFEVEDRIARNSAIIMTTMKVLETKLADKLPYRYDDLKKVVMDNMKNQMGLISNTNETHTFWDMVEFLVREGRIKEGEDFVFEDKKMLKITVNRKDEEYHFQETTNVVFMRFSKIIPLYKEAFKRQNASSASPMDKGSLMHYLTNSKPFVGLVSAIDFSVRDGETKKTTRTSAYAFNYDMLQAMGVNLGGASGNTEPDKRPAAPPPVENEGLPF